MLAFDLSTITSTSPVELSRIFTTKKYYTKVLFFRTAQMHWIIDSPTLILFSIGLVSFLESLALVGILVPGVVMLFSLSVLANTANLSPITIVIVGALGAFIGDVISFYLGQNLKHYIYEGHWFKRHQSWISQGQWFCKKWGWLSIIIGRFLGPLRPVVPLVTGMLDMPSRKFIPLCFITVLLWAPAYILPGYFTGELSDLWQLQPLGTRSLIILFLTAVSIVCGMLIMYHHMHPEQLHIKGWITKHQADHWPLPSMALFTLTALFLFTLWLATPLKNDTVFSDWALDWQNQTITPFWTALSAISHVKLLTIEFVLIQIWLITCLRWRLFIISTVTLLCLMLVSVLFLDYTQSTQKQAFINLSMFVFCLGFLANIVCGRFHRRRRWPIYFTTSLITLLIIVSYLWNGALTLSLCGFALFFALIASSLLRTLWQLLYLPTRVFHIRGIILLLITTNTAAIFLAI